MKVIFIIIGVLPLWLNRALGFSIGYLVNLFGGKNKSIVKQNIDLCFPNLSQQKRQKIIKKSLIELGKYTIENFFIWNRDFINNKKYIKNIQGIDLIKNNKPTILLTPHFGGFEITGRVISLYRPVMFLYKKVKHQSVEKIVFEARNKDNLMMQPTTNRGISQLSKYLKSGGLIGILPDHHPSGAGIISPFFNIPTTTTTLLSKFALKYDAEVLFTYALRVRGGYNLVIEKTDIRDSDINTSVNKINKAIENLIKKYPEQYIWNYKKFRSTYKYK